MGLADLHIESDYTTGESDLAADFYSPCLNEATYYDRGVGYFRSSVFHLIGTAFAEFASRGGTARLVCCPRLSQEDANAMAQGYKDREAIIERSLERDLTDLLTTARSARAVDLLATLVRIRALEVRIAVRDSGRGIYHEKVGIFRDNDGSAVSFKGSSNESFSAWDINSNHESFEVFRSWRGVSEHERCEKHLEKFERLWQSNSPGLQIYNLPDAFHRRLLDFSNHDIAEFIGTGHGTNAKPRRSPFPHQRDALQSWKDARKIGILKHATGSGKTYTALLAIREHIENGMPALVLVPSLLLLEQWRLEIQGEIPDAHILLCGGGHTEWANRRTLRAFTSEHSKNMRVTVATMQTAATPRFRRLLAAGQHLFLVADEVHQLGSPFCQNALQLATGPRLGLSATPERYGDKEGTDAILKYFHGIISPEFTLRDAIAAQRLVKYRYHPQRIDLTAEETESWVEFSDQIAKIFASRHSANPSGARDDKQLSRLLIQRARIAKHAEAKVPLAKEILQRSAAPGERWLVYCEDMSQLEEVKQSLRDAQISVLEYHTSMRGDPRNTLREFRYYGGVLLSIRCLDEGVDIPEITHALILASSRNPRQFIQRRGRVLRTAPHKTSAEIYDTLVVPPNLEGARGVASLVQAELARALEFANDAINNAASAWIERMLIDAGWDPESLLLVGEEQNEAEGGKSDGQSMGDSSQRVGN